MEYCNINNHVNVQHYSIIYQKKTIVKNAECLCDAFIGMSTGFYLLENLVCGLSIHTHAHAHMHTHAHHKFSPLIFLLVNRNEKRRDAESSLLLQGNMRFMGNVKSRKCCT